MLNKNQFHSLVGDLKDPDNGGFSVDINSGDSPEGGFMVARAGNEQSIRSNRVSPGKLERYANNKQDELSKPNAYFGGWHDRSRKMVDLDVAQHIPDTPGQSADVGHADARTSALDLSIARNQRAAFDLKTFSDLPNPDFKEPKSGDRR
jgi:hypothetical protein